MQALGEIKYFLRRFPKSLSIKVLGQEPKTPQLSQTQLVDTFFILFLNADEYFLIKKQALPYTESCPSGWS